jgi:hypothetical protein
VPSLLADTHHAAQTAVAHPHGVEQTKKGHREDAPFFFRLCFLRPPRDHLKNKKVATATRKLQTPAVAGY